MEITEQDGMRMDGAPVSFRTWWDAVISPKKYTGENGMGRDETSFGVKSPGREWDGTDTNGMERNGLLKSVPG